MIFRAAIHGPLKFIMPPASKIINLLDRHAPGVNQRVVLPVLATSTPNTNRAVINSKLPVALDTRWILNNVSAKLYCVNEMEFSQNRSNYLLIRVLI